MDINKVYKKQLEELNSELETKDKLLEAHIKMLEVFKHKTQQYENRKCDDCKRFINMEFEQVDNNARKSINKVRACQYRVLYVPNNFSCKHWEQKTA